MDLDLYPGAPRAKPNELRLTIHLALNFCRTRTRYPKDDTWKTLGESPCHWKQAGQVAVFDKIQEGKNELASYGNCLTAKQTMNSSELLVTLDTENV